MAAGKSTTTATTKPADEGSDADFDEADGLFGDDGSAPTDDEFGDADDLLDEVDEDDAEAWNPTERGESISGRITKVGETKSDFAQPGQDPMVPVVTVQTRDGKFRIIGFASVLKKELIALRDAGRLVPGNLFAAKYWGDKVIRRGQFAGKTYRHYSVAAQAPKSRQG